MLIVVADHVYDAALRLDREQRSERLSAKVLDLLGIYYPLDRSDDHSCSILDYVE